MICIKEFMINEYKGENIIIYGANMGGKVVYQCLQQLGIKVSFFCDRSQKGRELYGLTIIDPKDIANAIEPTIIINALTRSFKSACQCLEELHVKEVYTAVGLVAGKSLDDFLYEDNDKVLILEFLKKYPIYVQGIASGKIILPTLEVFVTERCTLRCRDCSHLIPRYTNPKDYDISKIISWLENVLCVVDYIEELLILGGEPILYRQLVKLLEWAYCEEKIGLMTIISNASVMPSENALKAMKRTKTRLRLSDYGKYSICSDDIKRKCKNEGIECFTVRELWTDMGEIYNHNYTHEQLLEIFTDCPFAYDLLLLNGRIYRCAHVGHLNNLGVVQTEEHDSVDFRNMDNIQIDKKREEIKQYMQIDYLEGCSYCNGIRNSISGIEPAIQGKR